MEFSLLAAALLGVALALLTLRVERIRKITDRTDLIDLVLGSAVVGLVIGRVAAMVLQGTNPFTHPLDLFLVRGGVDTGFASLGALGYLSWAARKDLWQTVDLIAPAALAGLGGWHAGCLMRGTCAGVATTLPWAIHDGTVGRHPVELYAAAALLLGAITLVMVRKRLPSGVPALLALGLAGGVRLATEPLRVGFGSNPAPWYLAAVVVGVLGTMIRVKAHRSRNISGS